MPITNEIILPYPHKNLSPNSRCHWRTRHQYAKRAKQDAFRVLKSLVGLKIPETCKLKLIFVKRTAHRFDLDNALASMKPWIDGLAVASGVDDANWSYELEKRVDRSTRYNHVIVQWSVDADAV